MVERIDTGRRAAFAVASAFAVFMLAGCGGERSRGGVQAQPGVYPLLLIGLFLVIGGGVATWAMYRNGGRSKSATKRSGRSGSGAQEMSDDAQADVRPGADGADDGSSK